ncbi:MAG TPA: hypothetical protein VFV81_00980 [Verrucomicrobiae bacterium]|nr:hypothetical protein [Verrucomicrobiae bacterium]
MRDAIEARHSVNFDPGSLHGFCLAEIVPRPGRFFPSPVRIAATGSPFGRMQGDACRMRLGRSARAPRVAIFSKNIMTRKLASFLLRENFNIAMMLSRTDYLASLRSAILLRHQCKSIHRDTAIVCHVVANRVLWEGEVEVFELAGHERAELCYAWMSPQPDSVKIITVLGNRVVNSALEAVRAAMFADVQPPKTTPLFLPEDERKLLVPARSAEPDCSRMSG